MDGYRKNPARFECVFTRIALIGDLPVDSTRAAHTVGESGEFVLRLSLN